MGCQGKRRMTEHKGPRYSVFRNLLQAGVSYYTAEAFYTRIRHKNRYRQFRVDLFNFSHSNSSHLKNSPKNLNTGFHCKLCQNKIPSLLWFMLSCQSLEVIDLEIYFYQMGKSLGALLINIDGTHHPHHDLRYFSFLFMRLKSLYVLSHFHHL